MRGRSHARSSAGEFQICTLMDRLRGHPPPTASRVADKPDAYGHRIWPGRARLASPRPPHRTALKRSLPDGMTQFSSISRGHASLDANQSPSLARQMSTGSQRALSWILRAFNPASGRRMLRCLSQRDGSHRRRGAFGERPAARANTTAPQAGALACRNLRAFPLAPAGSAPPASSGWWQGFLLGFAAIKLLSITPAPSSLRSPLTRRRKPVRSGIVAPSGT